MAMTRMNYMSGGSSITADLNNLLGSITTAGGSYTTTQNCIMIGEYTSPNTSQNAMIYIDGNNFVYGDTTGYQRSIGYQDIGMAIPAGHTMSTRNIGTYDIRFYGLA